MSTRERTLGDIYDDNLTFNVYMVHAPSTAILFNSLTKWDSQSLEGIRNSSGNPEVVPFDSIVAIDEIAPG